VVLDESSAAEPIGRRRVHAGDAWHDDVPVYDGDALRPRVSVVGPALMRSRFTTIVLASGDDARMRPNGDVLVEIAPSQTSSGLTLRSADAPRGGGVRPS
jgi:N-methylhydantoinase A/oxoprolinase/acetone carboxylase beta subunit